MVTCNLFCILANSYCYPIDAQNVSVLPNKSFDEKQPMLYLEITVLLGWELLFTRFAEFSGEKACARLSICQQGIYSDIINVQYQKNVFVHHIIKV